MCRDMHSLGIGRDEGRTTARTPCHVETKSILVANPKERSHETGHEQWRQQTTVFFSSQVFTQFKYSKKEPHHLGYPSDVSIATFWRADGRHDLCCT